MPAIDTFTMDEAMVLYEYSGLTLDQVPALDVLHPGFVAAMLHIGMTRVNPGMSYKAVKAVVGTANLLEILAAMQAATEDIADVDPPTQAASEPPAIGPELRPTGDASENDGESFPENHLRAIGSQV